MKSKRAFSEAIRKIVNTARRTVTTASLPDDGQRMYKRAETSSIVKLHFGCGPRILKGWINIDLAFEPYDDYLQYYGDRFYPPEMRGDKDDFFVLDVATQLIPLPSNSVDIVFHEDFIEHLDQRTQIFFLAEVLRVLKPDGIHRVNTPDLIESMRQNSEFRKGGAGVFVAEWDRHGHKNVLSKRILEEMALLVGYREVRVCGRNESVSKLIPSEYRPDPRDRDESGNLFADLIK